MERYTSAAIALMLSIIFAGSLLGCGRTPSPFVGTWVGKRTLAQVPDNPYLAASLAHVEIHLRADGSFLLKEAGTPKTGSVEFKGKEATLKVEKFMGKPISALGSSAEAMNQPIQLTILEDGTLKLVDPTGFDPAPLILRKTSETPEPFKR